MPMKNALNVSELLKRLGVVGDSLGSAPLLEAMRLTINLADLSDLVPPLGTPVGGASDHSDSVPGTFNQWYLLCRSPGGLRVHDCMTNGTPALRFWISDTDPYPAVQLVAHADLSFRQPTLSQFWNSPASASVAPSESFTFRGISAPRLLMVKNWVGPGQFFNIESDADNKAQQLCALTWTEYPAGLNP